LAPSWIAGAVEEDFMRKVGIALLIIVVLILAAALIVPHLIDINSYHGQIQAQLEKKLGRQVALGQMSLSLFPPSFQVADVMIGENPSFNTGRPFAAAEKLAVSVKLLPLLHKQVEIKSLELDRPRIELVRNPQGEWNFATLGQESKPAPAKNVPAPQQKSQPQPSPQPSQPAESGNQPAGQLTLANLRINDGQVAITDLQKHQSRAMYDHIDLEVSDFAPGQEFSIKAAAHLPGQGKESVSLQGKGGPIRQADLLNTNFDGKLGLNQVSISGLQKFLNSQALSGIDSQVSGDAKIRNAEGKLASSGTIKLDNPRIHSVNVGYPIGLDYNVADDLKNDVIQIQHADIKLGATPITIAGTLNTKPTPAQIDLKLTAAHASIAEAARLASAFGVAFGHGMDVNGQIDMNIHAKGAMNQPSMNGRLTVHDVAVSGKELPQPVKVNSVDLTLTPDAIRSNEFTATSGSTNVMVNFLLSQYTSPRSSIDASLKTVNAHIGELLNMAKAYGVSAVEGMSGDGLLSLDVHAQGPIKDPAALNFSGAGKVQNAWLKPPTLTKPVQIRNSDMRFNQNSATLDNLAASIGQTNATGSMTLKNFTAPQVQFALNADKVNVTELQQLQVSSPAAPKRAKAGGFWQLVPAAEAQAHAATSQPSMITKMTGGGTVNIGTVQYDNLVLNNVHSNVTLDRGVIRLNPLTSQLYGGQENGSVTIDARQAQPVIAANIKTDRVDANKLLSAVSSMKEVLYGLLTSNVNASFSAANAESIVRTLNGKLGLNLVNGKLANVDLLHELGAVAKFAGGSAGAPKGFTNVTQLSGNFDVKNGVAQTNDLKAAIDGGTMAAAGLVNLADQTLNLHVTAVLNKAMSQQVGGTQVGGFMNTALANSQGELVVPVIVTGRFQHPQVAPDVQQIAQMKLKNLLPTSKNPGALSTGGIVGSILGNQAGGNNQQGKTGVQGILGAIGGKQQPNQQQNQQQNQQLPTGQPAGNAGQQQQPAQGAVEDILNQVLKKKKQQQQQPPPK
jgi:AsmA protein